MKKCRRMIHAALTVGLLTAAIQATAQPSTSDGQTIFEIFARVEAVVAKLWPFNAITQTSTEESEVDTAQEALGAIGKIGIDIDIGGVAQPTEDHTNSAVPDCSPGPQDG